MYTSPEPAPTLEDVWRLFRETDRLIKEQAHEAERRSLELDRKFQKTDHLIKEQAYEAERRSLELDRKFQETDRLIKELKDQTKETDKRFRETNKKLGELGNRLGEFVEGFIKPGIIRLLRERGIDVEVVTRDVEVKRPHLNLAMQIDLLAINGDSCVLIEVKSRLCAEDVQEHLERMDKFKVLLPEYKDRKVFGAVAGMVVNEEVVKYAYRQGFFVITQKGDIAVILNDETFQPKTW
jgi:hypothetical protein